MLQLNFFSSSYEEISFLIFFNGTKDGQQKTAKISNQKESLNNTATKIRGKKQKRMSLSKTRNDG